MPDRLFGLVEREVALRGGGDAEVYLCRSRMRRFDARDGGIDSLSLADAAWFGVRVFRSGRMGFSYGFREDEGCVREAVEAALFGADASDPDPAYGLPDGALPAASPAAPPLYDPACEAVGDDEKAAFARELERLVLARDRRIKRVRSASLKESVTEVAFRNSAGRSGRQKESAYEAAVDAVAEEGTEGQTGYGFGFARRLSALDPDRIAAEAAGRALRMLGAKPLPSGRIAAVLENVAAADLLDVLAPSFLASHVAKGKSMFAGKVGQSVGARALTVVDDPFEAAGSGASAFDGEGVPSRRNVLLEGGILKGFLADAFWGRRIGTGTTASCRRPGPKAPPAVGISNLAIRPGEKTLPELLREVRRGVLLTEFLGIHTADPVSGDFSVGAVGILFEGGEEKEPVRGFAVSGNVIGLLARLAAVGSDFRWSGAVGSPSLAVEALEAGGS